jgi:predicted ferric reductase
MKKLWGYLVTLSPAIGVLAIWLTVEPIAGRFDGASATLLSFSGLIGILLFSLSLALNLRVKAWAKIGLEPAQVVKLHHSLSLWAFFLMFAHPLFLAVNLGFSSIYQSARLLVPLKDLYYLFGFLSLWLLVPVILFVDGFKTNHKLWLWIHRLTIVSFGFGVLHLIFWLGLSSGQYHLFTKDWLFRPKKWHRQGRVSNEKISPYLNFYFLCNIFCNCRLRCLFALDRVRRKKHKHYLGG